MILRTALLASLLLGLVYPSHAQNEFLVETTPLAVPRAFHGAAVLNEYVYVFGGSVTEVGGEEQIPTTNCQVARIGEDGHLSRWINTLPLVYPRHYTSNSTIVLNDFVYVLGGSTGIVTGSRIPSVAYTRSQPNGLLAPWLMSQSFPGSGFSCTASFATPGYLHLTGGLAKGSVSNQVWSVEVLPDGSLGDWRRGPNLPEPLWFHCAAVVGGRAFIWGGLNTPNNTNVDPSTKIYSAPILSTGQLGPWQTYPSELPRGIYSAETAVAGPYLFAICPRYKGGERTTDIWWTYVTPDGIVPWKVQKTPLPNPVFLAAAQDYRRGTIYITGGKRNGNTHYADNYILRLSPEARRLAEEEWLSTSAASSRSVSSSEFTARGGVPTGPSTSSVPGFYSLDQGRAVSAQKRQPLVVYFHIDKAQPCLEQVQHFQNEQFTSLSQKAAFASIDANRFPQLAQQYGVFRVPTWILFATNGKEQKRAVGVQSVDQLATELLVVQ